MTQRELTLQKHLEDINLHESVRDAIHDSMKEHAIEFAKHIAMSYVELTDGNWYHKDDVDGDYPLPEEQLYNKFNLNK